MNPTSRLWFLGAPRAEYAGQPVPGFASRKALPLLAYLATRRAPVPRGQLVALFWPDQPDEQGRASLRYVLHSLAARLPGCLAVDRQTVQLLGEPVCWTDTVAFEALAAQNTLRSLVAAAELCRGPLLDGLFLDDSPEVDTWLAQERELWHERVARLLVDLSVRARERREWETGLRAVERLLLLDPWREAAHQEKMRLLALSGQRDSAMAQFELCRRVLADELGLDPSPETIALYDAIRDGALTPSAAAAPMRLSVPLPPTPLLGRADELAQLTHLLAQPTCRLLTLLGPGGVGKTRLALELAAHQQARFDDGACVVELAALHDPALVVPALAQALLVPESGARPAAERMAAWLRDKHLLLVLDNVEQLLGAAPLVRELLAASPKLSVLATSRAPLHLRGEQEFPVGPLATIDPQRLRAPGVDRVAALAQSAAALLFVERARSLNPHFSVTHTTAPLIAEICTRLDGLPLAIELAAARSKLFSPAALLARLEHRLPFLTGRAPDRLPHQQTIRSTIAWSYQLLEEHEQAIFVRLGVFVGGWTIEAAEAVASVDVSAESSVVEGIASLVDQSLVRQHLDEHGNTRFSMLETIRDYALEQLEASTDSDQIHRQHASFFLNLAEEARQLVRGSQYDAALERLQAEHDNLRAALAFAIEQRESELALGLASALWPFWHLRGHLAEGLAWLNQALELAKRDISERCLDLVNGAATLAAAQGNAAQANALTEELLALARARGDQRWVGVALLNRWANQRNSRFIRAASFLENSLVLHQGMGNQTESIHALLQLGLLLLRSESFHIAWERYQAALRLAKTVDNDAIIAACLDALAQTAALSGLAGWAAQLLGAAAMLRAGLGAPREPAEQALYEQWEVTVRAQLDPTQFDAAWERGQAMSQTTAVEYALALSLSIA